MLVQYLNKRKEHSNARLKLQTSNGHSAERISKLARRDGSDTGILRECLAQGWPESDGEIGGRDQGIGRKMFSHNGRNFSISRELKSVMCVVPLLANQKIRSR